ncbi:MAG: protein kinase, partial [Planctomycetota bacterium]
MSDVPTPICPRCETPVPANAEGQLCPACLLSGAIEASGDLTVSVSPGDPTIPVTPTSTPSSATGGLPSTFPRTFGGYRLLGKLGEGGMGSVYEAEELSTGRRLALKMLGSKLNNLEMRQRFLREGRLAASVSHPNSLYVFGTEEIEGSPVITMELAAGGTLSDRLKERGPASVNEAVDATLDVIAGLESALSGGVLHRDIKPSNCFVYPNGSVKIGDFGLSVSTTAKVDSFMTATGVIMGTPAYAPPEQLRGKDLDHRADIYSVGATLFTLLTGKPPIEGANAVEVVAAALEETPKLVSEVRDEVPRGLAQVIARCLSKKPEQRFSDYATLRTALLPFGSTQPEPAPMGRRVVAGVIDLFVSWNVPSLLVLSLFGIDVSLGSVLEHRESPNTLLAVIGLSVVSVLYFTTCEGLWGAGLGKLLTGFRVIRVGGSPPGLLRAFGRAVIDKGVSCLAILLSLTVFVGLSPEVRDLLSVGTFVLGFLVFVTMRRSNGFATVWDLVSGTRVVVNARGAERPVVDAPAETRAESENAEVIGSFSVVREIVPGDWIAARDPVLRRPVWLRRRSEADLAPARRDLSRPGRNRWLQSVAKSTRTWDVFESRDGVPFRGLLNSAGQCPWGSLRHWIHDIASEVASAARDETLPRRLSFDHVWITTGGRAVLLDEPWPEVEERAEEFDVGNLEGRQRFVSAMAACTPPTTVPVHARPVLESLAAGSFEKLSFLAGNLRSLLTRPATVRRAQRAASLLIAPILGLTAMILSSVAMMTHGLHLDPNSRFNQPEITVWKAASTMDLEQLQRNLCAGVDLDAEDPNHESTPLSAAARKGYDDVVSLLIEHGADVNLQGRDGWTALHHAAYFGHTDT